MAFSNTLLPAIAVFGPTCVGKTALGIKIAQALDGEVLSIDSLQCYRDGAIITAQATPEEQAEVPHHLVGYLGPDEEPHADFNDRVRAVLADLKTRQKLPVLVGGSTSLFGPILSDMSDNGYRVLGLVLQPPSEGNAWEDRIGDRIDVMVKRGMLDEIEELHRLYIKSGQTEPSSGVWKTIGYPEMRPYLTCSAQDRHKRMCLDEGLRATTINSIKYGRYQLRWIQDTLIPDLGHRNVEFENLIVPGFAPQEIKDYQNHAINRAATFANTSDSNELDKSSDADTCSDSSEFMREDSSSTHTDETLFSSVHSDVDAAYASKSCDSPAEGSDAINDGNRPRSWRFSADDLDVSCEPGQPAETAARTGKTDTREQRVVCVFAGSSPGASPKHVAAARSLACAFARANIKLVYGGGTTGVMGVLSSTLVSLAGPSSVHGIVPRALARYEEAIVGKDAFNSREKEFGIRTIVPDMHTRKRMMVDQVRHGPEGSGFIALSGGYGTLEELLEMITWKQLGIHGSSVCVLNSDGFYDGLVSWLESSVVGSGFVKGEDGEILEVAHTAEEAIQKLHNKRLEGRTEALRWT